MSSITENYTINVQQFLPEKKLDNLNERPGRVVFLGIKELHEGFELLEAHTIMLLDVVLS